MKRYQRFFNCIPRLLPLLAIGGLLATLPLSIGQNNSAPPDKSKEPEFPDFSKVFEDYTEVISRGTTNKSLMSLWIRPKDNQMLAALPPKFEKKRFYIALTISSGERYAGLQAGEIYGYWRRYDKRLAFIQPNLAYRSTGEEESKSSVQRLFTDRVIFDVPIETMMPKWGPVIDMDALLVEQAEKFFGSAVRGINPKLASISTSEAFPENIELAFEVPVAGGQLKTLHYSISVLPEKTGYKPRLADERVGYFTTTFHDLGKYEDKTTVRYINRWHLEKADPKLKVSPPKEPIIFYIEHTTPIRYRRWVREGILMWNHAFEKVGLANAIEVRYQDAATGAHMDKHPEDVRWNFIRWLNNDVGTAIGPSRVDPTTGQILDADIILTDGWIRHYWSQYKQVLPDLAMEGFTPQTLAWLEQHPQWDPRVRLAAPAERNHLLEERARQGSLPYGGHPLATIKPQLMGDNEFDGLGGRISQINGLCRAADYRALDMALMRFNFELMRDAEDDGDNGDAENGDEEKPKKDKDEELLDGIPEWFVGPLVADLVAHEVGHTLGLRHNFKSSSVYTVEEINSEKIKGKVPFAGSVMDYLPINMYTDEGTEQGDYAMIDIGPYDKWAIEYGYSIVKSDKELEPILERVSDPLLQYATDEDTYGPDPLARRYDFGSDPLAYAKSQITLITQHRKRLLDKFVKEGESWARAREGYEMTLGVQTRCLSMMANWLGGSFVHRDKKGDENGRPPLEVVPAEEQRAALRFVVNQAFKDEAFGLKPEMLKYMTLDKWWDDSSSVYSDSTWPVHDRISGIQSSVLTMLMNPSTLERMYDNEFRTPSDQDMITLPELLDTLHDSIWTELKETPEKTYTARQPLISSLRRTLQSEFLDRLIDLSMDQDSYSVSSKPISNLATMHLRKLQGAIGNLLEDDASKLDPYTNAHLSEALSRIESALDAGYIYNARSMGGGAISIRILADEENQN